MYTICDDHDVSDDWYLNREWCDRYLGIPENDLATGLPKFQADGDVSILSRDPLAIPWHYKITSHVHEVIVLDTRTWRGYPTEKERSLEPPRLLSPWAFKHQLENPLSQSQSNIAATMIVLPTNMVILGIIDLVQRFELSRDRAYQKKALFF